MQPQIKIPTVNDFSEVLATYGLKYTVSGHYWQVGVITAVQGWILHLSVVRAQLLALLEQIIPFLMVKAPPFKVVRDTITVSHLMSGSLGYIHLGKMISIYPASDEEALVLARELVALTRDFEGPAIPTDRHLGSIVYTRYGSFNPVLISNHKGEPVKHINDAKGRLIPDPYSIPFSFPAHVSWPFSILATPMPPRRRKLLNYAYYPLFTLKPDVKGEVIKALYFKRFWNIHPCLIKQGRHHLSIDDEGRDIRARLQWQYDLYKALHEDVPMPEVFDYFEEYGDSYLAMAFIKGKSLQSWIDSLYKGGSWQQLALAIRLSLIDRLLEIAAIILRMHAKGYVHRDITAGNFLIDRKGCIWLIDLELAWSLDQQYPDPPFTLGTSGFMSPEQQATSRIPTVKEDIYGMGALAIQFFTNLWPIKLDQSAPECLQNALEFFIGDQEMAATITRCHEEVPQERPTLEAFRGALARYRARIADREEGDHAFSLSAVDRHRLENLIRDGLMGLSHPPFCVPGGGWFSISQRKEVHIGNQQAETDIYPGWHTGLAGPLWLMAKARMAGFDVSDCMEAYNHSWNFLCRHFLANPSSLNIGLFTGLAGAALAIAAGMDSGLISPTPENIARLSACFIQPEDRLNLADGSAGQGMALLAAVRWVDPTSHMQLLQSYVQQIIDQQLPDGAWETYAMTGKKKCFLTGLNKGIAGITWFLLAYLERYPDDCVRSAIDRALHWLIAQGIKRGKQYTWTMSTGSRQTENFATGYGAPGIALLFTRAFQVTQDPLYGEVAQNSLLALMPHPVYPDFSLDTGMTGLGDVYLEAYKVFQSTMWMEKADWIAQLLLHCAKRNHQGGVYWLPKNPEFPTADFLSGNSGILHFLIRYCSPTKMNHFLNL